MALHTLRMSCLERSTTNRWNPSRVRYFSSGTGTKHGPAKSSWLAMKFSAHTGAGGGCCQLPPGSPSHHGSFPREFHLSHLGQVHLSQWHLLTPLKTQILHCSSNWVPRVPTWLDAEILLFWVNLALPTTKRGVQTRVCSFFYQTREKFWAQPLSWHSCAVSSPGSEVSQSSFLSNFPLVTEEYPNRNWEAQFKPTWFKSVISKPSLHQSLGIISVRKFSAWFIDMPYTLLQ